MSTKTYTVESPVSKLNKKRHTNAGIVQFRDGKATCNKAQAEALIKKGYLCKELGAERKIEKSLEEAKAEAEAKVQELEAQLKVEAEARAAAEAKVEKLEKDLKAKK